MKNEQEKLTNAITKIGEAITILKELNTNVGFDRYADALGFAESVRQNLEEIKYYNQKAIDGCVTPFDKVKFYENKLKIPH